MSTAKQSAAQNEKYDVAFHPEQLKYLERMFERAVLPPSSTTAEVHHYFGQQSVLQCIRNRTRL